ncbi:MAG: aldo/keto reductase [Gemmatimonadaceae bacterium]
MSDDRSISRRDAVKLGLGAGVALAVGRSAPLAAEQQAALITRPIPSSGERIPIVGMGTAVIYQNPKPEEIPPLRDTLKLFPELGGKVLDTAPSYGRAESVVGDILAELKNRDKYFIATKVSVRGSGGRDEVVTSMDESLKRFKTDRIDLMQIWNVSNPALIAPILAEWKASKKIRYTGITSSFKGQYGALEAAMKAFKYDFVQIDLAIDNRDSQERIVPLAADLGMAVLVNSPFGRNRVFQKTAGKSLPDWAKEYDMSSWAQFALKYIVSNPQVTCAIPGIGTTQYLSDDLGAARGRLPDAATRKKMEAYLDQIV